MTPLQTLKAARDLISDPARWTQGWWGKSPTGECVDAGDKKATSWCAVGAIEKVGDWCRQTNGYLLSFSYRLYGKTPYDFNDTHTHAEVIALFDAAIAELEGVAS